MCTCGYVYVCVYPHPMLFSMENGRISYFKSAFLAHNFKVSESETSANNLLLPLIRPLIRPMDTHTDAHTESIVWPRFYSIVFQYHNMC